MRKKLVKVEKACYVCVIRTLLRQIVLPSMGAVPVPHCFLFVLFPQLYFYSFLFVLSLPEQRVLIAFCRTNRKVSLDRLTRTMELHPHHYYFVIMMMMTMMVMGKVSWDGLDGLTDCPAVPSLPYLLHPSLS